MNLLVLLVLGIVALFAGYIFYGSILSRILKLDPRVKTPACQFNDNKDFVPANKWYLVSQHLSAIAAAGPIVGPLLAGMWFGWVPAFIWIVLGGIFIGGVHDLVTLVASLRHQGRSIAEVIRENMSPQAYILFLLFLWFTIVYIITAFTDITASTFIEPNRGPQVASSSMLYLGLALAMGLIMKLTRISLVKATFIFIPFVFLCIYLGPVMPVSLKAIAGMDVRTSWDVVLLGYCFIAAVVPVWLLLQPRGYLGGFFLSFTAGLTFIGIIAASIAGNLIVQYPAFTGWASPQGLPLIPMLFTTVACGACSGFHAIVASGTTSKQIANEKDAKLVGFGGMLMESFVALIALGTLLVLSSSQAKSLQDPNQIFAKGVATFLNTLGIDPSFAYNFALLAFATFVYDTLDVATRLGRYIFQELTGLKGIFGVCAATAATLLLPFIFVTQKFTDSQGNIIYAWKVFWTVFGSSNQLLAAMVLLGLSVWFVKKKIPVIIVLLPALFMTLVALFSLGILLQPWFTKVISSGKIFFEPMVFTTLILLILACFLIFEASRIFIARIRRMLALLVILALLPVICLAQELCLTKDVCVKGVCIPTEVADNASARSQGLMYRLDLAQDKGMLFVFDKEDRYGFWMKNVNFPLDIIWIDKSFKVVDISSNVLPCKDNCDSILPHSPAQYVLEVNAGFAANHNIQIGDSVEIK